MATVAAIYENGTFRLEGPVALVEGARVELVILPMADKPSVSPPCKTSEEILAGLLEIAKTAVPSDKTTHVARDHDLYLYGSKE